MSYQIPVENLRGLACPLTTPPWPEVKGCLLGAIWRSVKGNLYETAPVAHEQTVDAHASRIASLMKSGWDDPIQLDVGVPGQPGWEPIWPVIDGNHRLAAAILTGRNTIQAEISGSLDYAEEVFGIRCDEGFPEEDFQTPGF